MNRMEAYTKLFDLQKDDNRLDTTYYIRLLSKSDDVPNEVIDYINENSVNEGITSDDEVEVPIDNEENNDTLDEDSDSGENNTSSDEEIASDDDVSDVVITVSDEVEDTSTEDQIDNPNGEVIIEVDPVVDKDDDSSEDNDRLVLDEFVSSLKKNQVYRKIRNSNDPMSLAKSVSAFCTRYLIEVQTTAFDKDIARKAINDEISIPGVLDGLAMYIGADDLEALDTSVASIRGFLKAYE